MREAPVISVQRLVQSYQTGVDPVGSGLSFDELAAKHNVRLSDGTLR